MTDVKFRATVKHDGAEVGDLPWREEFWAVRYDDYAALQARVAELEAAEWHVRHVDTMNDMVLLGLDRDEWKHRAEAAEQRVATLEPLLSEAESIPDYNAGLLNDWGGGNVEWWQDYLRAEIARANEHWRACVAQLKEGRG